MATDILINPKLAQVFANDSQQMKFLAAAMEQILGEEKTETLISQILPQEQKASPKFKGQPLVMFNGLDREQLKRLHKFTDAEVDEVAGLLGVNLDETGQSDAEVTREAVEHAGTATELIMDGKVSEPGEAVVVTDGASEATVDAAEATVDAAKATVSAAREQGQKSSATSDKRKTNERK